MQHRGTQIIETERLLLRPFVVEDADASYRNWTHDERVCKYLTWPPHKDVEETRQVLSEWEAAYSDPSFYQWAIVLKELGEPIGSISVVRNIDKIKAAHIGYCIGYDWWHQGIMTEAFQGVIDFLFGEVGINRIETQHDTNNPRSGSVMRSCGLSFEGTHRQADLNNTGIVDTSFYAILREDWLRVQEDVC